MHPEDNLLFTFLGLSSDYFIKILEIPLKKLSKKKKNSSGWSELGYFHPKSKVIFCITLSNSPFAINNITENNSKLSILFSPLVLNNINVFSSAYFFIEIESILYHLSNHKTSGAVFFLVIFCTIYLRVSYVHPPHKSSIAGGRQEGILRF